MRGKVASLAWTQKGALQLQGPPPVLLALLEGLGLLVILGVLRLLFLRLLLLDRDWLLGRGLAKLDRHELLYALRPNVEADGVARLL